MSRYGSGGNVTNMSNSGNNRSQITELFVKKILAHLDDVDPQKLNLFLNLFNTNNCKIIFNASPFVQPTAFLQMWQTEMIQSQHALTAVDYHVIPGSQTLICNVNCKVRFDESGKNKLGQDANIPVGQPNPNASKLNNRPNSRPLWGSYFGVSLQLIVDERIFRNDMNGVISGFNYNMVYKPEDSLLKIQ